MSDTKDQKPAVASTSASASASAEKTASTSTSTSAPPAKPEEKEEVKQEEEEEASAEPQEDVIDMETFQQIMDMDEEDEGSDDEEEKHSFSKGIVWGYFEQAEATFIEMEEAIAAEDLGKLSALGHFLKGSSAALGIIKVQASCEKMQHYGNKRDEEAGTSLEPTEALKRIKSLLTACKKDYQVAKKWMENLYEEDK